MLCIYTNHKGSHKPQAQRCEKPFHQTRPQALTILPHPPSHNPCYEGIMSVASQVYVR